MPLPPRSRPSLLIVDLLSSLVSPVMGPGGSEDGHALMICLGRALKGLAQRHGLAVITTNHIVGGIHPSHAHLLSISCELAHALCHTAYRESCACLSL